jgi:hypothetical protein
MQLHNFGQKTQKNAVAVFALNAPQHPTGKRFGGAPRRVDNPSSGSGSGTSVFIMRYKLLEG